MPHERSTIYLTIHHPDLFTMAELRTARQMLRDNPHVGAVFMEPKRTPTSTIYAPWVIMLDLSRNSAIPEQHLTEAKDYLSRGYPIRFIRKEEPVFCDEATYDVTHTQPTELSEKPKGNDTGWERTYWRLRTAIRQAILRHPEYKNLDPAETFEQIRKEDDLNQSTIRVEEWLHQIWAAGFWEGQKRAMPETPETPTAQEPTNIFDLIKERFPALLVKGGFHKGGIITLKPNELPVRLSEGREYAMPGRKLEFVGYGHEENIPRVG